MPEFFIRIQPTRADFLAGLTGEEQTVMHEHFAYWKRVMSEGGLLLAGPSKVEEAPFGILVVRADTAAAAEELVRSDPSVAARVQSYEIFPLRLSLYAGEGDEAFGHLNPSAPSELARFGFLIGRWRCEARFKAADGVWQTFAATWIGRYILDGYAIADDYRMTDASSATVVLGTNFRAYDAVRETWNIKWLNALAGTWVDLGSTELGGVTVDGPSISYVLRETVAGHAFTRATYTVVSEAQFTWRGEKSDDRATWSEFMVVEAYRA